MFSDMFQDEPAKCSRTLNTDEYGYFANPKLFVLFLCPFVPLQFSDYAIVRLESDFLTNATPAENAADVAINMHPWSQGQVLPN